MKKVRQRPSPCGLTAHDRVPPERKSKPLSPDHAALARAIEQLIAEDPQMSQNSVAADSGLNIRQVHTFTRGQGNPTYETLLRLCEGLHVSIGELMTLADALREADGCLSRARLLPLAQPENN